MPGMRFSLAATLLIASFASADEPAVPRIALIDVAWVLEHWDEYNAKRRQLRDEFASAVERVRREDFQRMRSSAERLKSPRLGIEQYRTMLDQIEKATLKCGSGFNRRLWEERREVRHKESELLDRSFQVIRKETRAFAEEHGMVLVLRHSRRSRSKINVQHELQSPSLRVLFYEKQLEISDEILERLSSAD
ncbi:MAG: OmpH family outer membrane protein [Planctomycetales bacterium]